MNIALTGAGGFLGGVLLKRLAAEPSLSVYAFSSQTQRLEALYQDNKQIKILSSRLCDSFDFSSVDVLIHCAFPMGNNGTQMAPGLDFIRRTLEQAVFCGVGAVIHISSQSVYDQKRREAARESTPLLLESPYATGKYAAELLTNSLCRQIPHSNLRLASLIGARLSQRLVNQFVLQILSGRQLHISGGDQRFGFLDVRDAADGILAMLQQDPKQWKEVYNLGQNESVSLLEIAHCVREVGKTLGIDSPALLLETSPLWHNSQLDCRLFQEQFGWRPAYSLADTVKDIFKQETEQ